MCIWCVICLSYLIVLITFGYKTCAFVTSVLAMRNEVGYLTALSSREGEIRGYYIDMGKNGE